MAPEVELTDEQKLDFVYFHMANEKGMLPQMHLALFGNGKPEDGIVYIVRHMARAGGFWRRLAYDVLKQTGSALVTAMIFGILALFWLGAETKLHLVMGQIQ